MFLYKILENPIINQLIFFILWLILLIFYNKYLVKKFPNTNLSFKITLLFIFLSFVALIRIYFNILPFTPDSIYYLDGFYRNDFFGPNIYEYFINFVKINLGNSIQILFLVNILLYCFVVEDLISIIPDYKNKNFFLFFTYIFFLPSVIWFIPNILRETLFIFFIVKVLRVSLSIEKNNLSSFLFTKILFFSFLSFSLRPQILPILFIWLSFILIKRKEILLLFISFVLLVVTRIDYIKNEIVNKISFHYLESFKTEGSGNLLNNIAFKELIIPTNFFELVLFSPKLLFRFLFSPFPWNLNNINYTFAYIDALFIVVLFLIILYKIFNKKIFSYHIFFFSLLFLFVLSIFEIAFTGAIRHRLPFILTLLPLIVFDKKSHNS